MKLKFSGKENSKPALIAEGLTAVLLGGSFVAFWVTALSLDWGPKTFFRGNPVKGFLSVWNQLADELGSAVYLILPKYSGGAGPEGESLPQGLFLTLAGVILALIFFLMIRSRCRAWLLLPVLPCLILMFCTGIVPSFPAALVLTAALAGAWTLMGGGSARYGTTACVLAVVLVVTLGAGILIDKKFSFSSGLVETKTSVAINKALHSRYGHGAFENGALNALSGKELRKARGSLQKRQAILMGSAKDKTETALEVKANQPASYYLRGFVGEKYEGDRWSPLKNSVYYSERDDLYWLNKEGFDGLSQLSRVAETVDMEEPENALSIRVKNADSSQLYIPYEAAGTARKLPEGSSNCAGSFLKSTKFMGTRDYQVRCGNNMTGTWTDWVGKLYSNSIGADLQGYFTSESHYNVWCYKHDTTIPESMREEFYLALGDPGDLTNRHADYKEAIESIRSYLEMNYSYSDNFRSLKASEDFLETFMDRGMGCDVHYASLATMMFRFYGIPSRYVEGYLITPGDVQHGASFKIGQSHQHAWTEIYVDGFGWVPIEVTPDYRYIMDEADMSIGLEAISYDNSYHEAPPEPEEDEEDVVNDRFEKLVRKGLIIGGLVVLGLLLLLLLFLVGRKILKEQKLRKEFNHSDPRHGVCAMYGFILDRKLPIRPEAVAIGDEAAFSQLEIGENRRAEMKKELEWSRKEGRKLRKEELKQKLAKYNWKELKTRISAKLPKNNKKEVQA